MRPLFIILLTAAVGCFCRVAAQDMRPAGSGDSVVIHRFAGYGDGMRLPRNTLVPLSALPDISDGSERPGLYSRRIGALYRNPDESYIIAPVMPEKVKVMGSRPIVPRRLSVNNGNAANWGNPYPSAYLDARTLSFPMRGIPRP